MLPRSLEFVNAGTTLSQWIEEMQCGNAPGQPSYCRPRNLLAPLSLQLPGPNSDAIMNALKPPTNTEGLNLLDTSKAHPTGPGMVPPEFMAQTRQMSAPGTAAKTKEGEPSSEAISAEKVTTSSGGDSNAKPIAAVAAGKDSKKDNSAPGTASSRFDFALEGPSSRRPEAHSSFAPARHNQSAAAMVMSSELLPRRVHSPSSFLA